MIKVEIDSDSGFCFGVVKAIQHAERELAANPELYCLGDIVHNSQEVARLQNKGLKTINHEELQEMRDKKILLRAHGEPPSTYEIADRNRIRIVDATCPVVLQLQRKIRKIYRSSDPENFRIVIFGKIGHAEVNGLVGQTEGTAVVIETKDDVRRLDFNKNIYLFSQTTMSVEDFKEIVREIQARVSPPAVFHFFDTICRQVANRISNIRKFALRHNLILFVAGEKSSNGKVLLHECKQANPDTYLISSTKDIDPAWFKGIRSAGICGATSTPKWLMEEVAQFVHSVMPFVN
ncbi:MAG: 4-hydroxy-3-methylbut-2-enyl diphosphate reductase [Dysgonamonadaceae bacterium]|nr:4-hydroxy-3-methylbut-2-enyl diphosphate reductase [Dysgonamonadaceae bacterium]